MEMSLVPDYDDSLSSSSEEASSNEEEAVSKTSIEILKTKLPTPNFQGVLYRADSDESIKTSSVFKNPFIEAENAKEAILQKHVKMVDAKKNVIVINGKKICWNYRKGRCRFGHNCKFAHDSDIEKPKEQVEVRNGGQNSQLEPSSQELGEIQHESFLQNQIKRKKRAGLPQGLVPGKKVMKKYAKQKI